MPKVSIIIPVYNTEDFLEECVKSLLNQTLSDIEIILVDDASTDQSSHIISASEQVDPRIHSISLEKNQGVGEARNKGLEIASGEFIAFVDSDDYVKQDMFEKLYQKALTEHAEIVLCDTDTYSSNGKKKSVWYKPIYGQAQLADLFHNTQPSSRIFSKKLIDRLQFRFLPGMGEGIIFELMINARHITTVAEKLYVYRSRDGSLSTTPNLSKNRESFLNNQLMGQRNPAYKDYFLFKTIEDLLQLVANAVKVNDKGTYTQAVRELKQLQYRQNPYLKTLYKEAYPLHRYYVKVHLLPSNFYIARLFSKLYKR